MIKSNKPLSMAESTEYLEKESNAMIFIKKFSTLSAKDAKEMRKKLEDLKLIKMNDSNISKIIDLVPERAEEVNKIFIDVGLDENETKKILDVVKEFI
jgi:DNA-directed RNA polymerase subunit F